MTSKFTRRKAIGYTETHLAVMRAGPGPGYLPHMADADAMLTGDNIDDLVPKAAGIGDGKALSRRGPT